ncbi:hypothetical protein SEUCBS139899_001963 [Sporothrix eucalyptigena]|uniref:Integral membrane protein n=1 Tax=Sporothrix eucalyptigena TaxID=1812306 RepID=A0ABP0CKP4_9PEZI
MASTAGDPITTLVPFASLPACATNCGHLYDANGACVPPAAATGDTAQYASCFCNDAQVAPFSTGTAGVCDDACTTDSGGLESIHVWFSSYCSVEQKAVATATTTGTTGTSTATSTSTSGSDSSGSKSTDNSWIATHYQWVIFIVVMVVGITSLWVGACMWHRRYLRKKDRQYALSNIRASTGAASGTTGLNDLSHEDDFSRDGAQTPHDAAGVFAPNAFDTEKRRSNLLSRRH